MAEAKALELREGARIGLKVTVYEDTDEKGTKGVKRLLHDANGRKIQTRVEDGQRFVQRVLFYPFPAGMARDPITGKEAVALNPTQLGHAIGEWSKDIALLKEN